MAALVQSKTPADVTGTSIGATFDTPPVQGHLLVACHVAVALQATVTPPSGWTVCGSDDDDFLLHSGSMYYKVAGAGESSTVTFSTASSVDQGLVIFEFSGVTITSPLDKQGASDPTGSGLSCNTGSTGTLSQANEVAVALIGVPSGLPSPSWDSGFTLVSTAVPRCAAGYKIAAATTALDPTLTWITNARRRTGMIATFKATTVIGDTADLRWPVRSPLGDSADLRWPVRAALGDTLDARWAVRAAVADLLDARWPVRASVGDLLDAVWAVLAAVGDTTDLEWGVRTSVGDPVDLRWGIRTAAGDATDLRWDLRSAVGDDLDARWAVIALALADLDLRWPVRVPVADALEALWGIRTPIGDGSDLRWAVRAAAGDSVSLAWVVLATLFAGHHVEGGFATTGHEQGFATAGLEGSFVVTSLEGG